MMSDMSGNNATVPLSPEGALYINIALKGRYTSAIRYRRAQPLDAPPLNIPPLQGSRAAPAFPASKTNGAAPLAGVWCPFRAKNIPLSQLSLTISYNVFGLIGNQV